MPIRPRLVEPSDVPAAVQRLLHGEDLLIAPVPTGPAMVPPSPASDQGATGLVMATSGSTGHPKYVWLSRAALLAAASATHARLGGPAVWVNALPLTYVAGVMTVVRAVAGGTRHVQVGADLRGIDTVAERAYLSVVPTQLYRALESPATMAALARFAAVLVGGAALDGDVRGRAEDDGVTVIETYGLSETCGGVVYDGEPLPGVTVRLGEGGRIALTTPSAFSGYLGDPVATAEVLDGMTVTTQDRGAWRGGRLTVLGRKDDVVQSGGLSIDLADLQRHLDALFPAAVACFGVPDRQWGTRIAVASTGPDLAAIVTGLGARVAATARPRLWVKATVLPRTLSGKIDRQGLMRQWEAAHGDSA